VKSAKKGVSQKALNRFWPGTTGDGILRHISDLVDAFGVSISGFRVSTPRFVPPRSPAPNPGDTTRLRLAAVAKLVNRKYRLLILLMTCNNLATLHTACAIHAQPIHWEQSWCDLNGQQSIYNRLVS